MTDKTQTDEPQWGGEADNIDDDNEFRENVEEIRDRREQTAPQQEPTRVVEDSRGKQVEIEKAERSVIGRLAEWAFGSVATVTPFRQRVFRRMTLQSLRNYHKVSGGDAIGIIAQGSQQIDIEPVKFMPAAERESGKPGWKAKGRDKTWTAGTEQKSVEIFGGKVPVVLLDDDDHVETSWMEARIAEAIALGQHSPVFENARFNIVVDANQLQEPEIVDGVEADGGRVPLSKVNTKLEVASQGQWAEDNLIDVSSQAKDEGMRIWHSRAKKWRGETADSEELSDAFDRGELAGQLRDDAPDAFKYLLVAVAGIVGALAMIFVVPKLLGGGGGGGGGIVPGGLTVMPWETLKFAVGGLL